MIRKRLTIIGLGALLCALVICFAACSMGGGSNIDSGDNNHSVTPDDNITNGIVISDFEKWEPSFSQMKIYSGFGKVTANEDKTYVKNGTGSAKIMPLCTDGENSALVIPLTSAKYNYNYADITAYSAFSTEIYNVQSEEKSVRIGIAFDKELKVKTKPMEFTLKHGWNHVELSTLSYPYMFTRPTVTSADYDVHLCYGLYFNFDKVDSYLVSDAPVFYFDDVSAINLVDGGLSVLFDEGKQYYNVGDTVTIPARHYFDKQGNTIIPVETISVSHEGQEVPISNGSITANNYGSYIAKIKATYGGVDNYFTYTMDTRLAPKENEMESFDDAYSLFSIKGNAPNMTFEYVNDFSATDDGTGSVKVTNQHAWGWPGILVKSRQNIDPSDYDYIQFKLYIDGTDMQKCRDFGDGKKYRQFGFYTSNRDYHNITLSFVEIKYLPVNEWVTITCDAQRYYNYATANGTKDFVSGTAETVLFFMFDDLESGYGESFRVQYYVDEFMFYKREFAENEIDACNSEVSLSYFSGNYANFSYSSSISHTDDGSGSICVTENGPWPSVNLKVKKSNEEILEYGFVSFWVYVDANEGLTDGHRELALYNLTKGQQYIVNRTWTQFIISTKEFVSFIKDGVFTQLICLMNDEFHYGQNTKLYIDEIVLFNREYAANEIDFCETSVSIANFGPSNDGVPYYDNNISHTADGTGSIAVRHGVEGWPGVNLVVNKTAEQINEYSSVTFWVRVSGAKAQYQFYVNCLGQTFTVNADEWTKVTVSASDFANMHAATTAQLLWVQNDGGWNDNSSVLYIDEISLYRRAENEIDSCGSDSVVNFPMDTAWVKSITYATDISYSDDGTGSIKIEPHGSGWPHIYIKPTKTAEEISRYENVSIKLYFKSTNQTEGTKKFYLFNSSFVYPPVNEWWELNVSAATFASNMDESGKVDLGWIACDGGDSDTSLIVYIDEIFLD